MSSFVVVVVVEEVDWEGSCVVMIVRQAGGITLPRFLKSTHASGGIDRLRE